MKSDNNILLLVPGFPKDENDFMCTPPVQDYLLKYVNIYPNYNFL